MHNATKIQLPLVCHHSPLTRWPGLSHAAHKLKIPDVLKKRRGFDWIVSGYSLIFVTLNIFFCQYFGKTLKIWRVEFHLPCFPLECKWIWRPDVMGWKIWPTNRICFGQKHERFWSSFFVDWKWFCLAGDVMGWIIRRTKLWGFWVKNIGKKQFYSHLLLISYDEFGCYGREKGTNKIQ